MALATLGVAVLSCGEGKTGPNVPLAIEFHPPQLPSMVVGDSMRDTLGNVDSLRAIVFNSSGDTIPDAPIRYVHADTTHIVNIDSVSGKALALDTGAGARRRAGERAAVAARHALRRAGAGPLHPHHAARYDAELHLRAKGHAVGAVRVAEVRGSAGKPLPDRVSLRLSSGSQHRRTRHAFCCPTRTGSFRSSTRRASPRPALRVSPRGSCASRRLRIHSRRFGGRRSACISAEPHAGVRQPVAIQGARPHSVGRYAATSSDTRAAVHRRGRRARSTERTADESRRRLSADIAPHPRRSRAPRRLRPPRARRSGRESRRDPLGESPGVGDRRLCVPRWAAWRTCRSIRRCPPSRSRTSSATRARWRSS